MNFKKWLLVEMVNPATQNKFVQIAQKYFSDAQNYDLTHTGSGQLMLYPRRRENLYIAAMFAL